MVWFFERSNNILELETRYDNSTGDYIVERRQPGSLPLIERFNDRATFRQRLLTIEATLTAAHWQPKGAPALLPHGWPASTPER